MAEIADLTERILREIQQTLKEMRTIADVDRRNSRTLYDNLTVEMARNISALDAKLEFGISDLQEQLNRIEGKIDNLRGGAGP